MQSRYYNSEWGRFISADVYTDTGDGMLGTNMYAYCQNDPVNLKDDTGTIAISTIVIIVVGAVGFGTAGGFGGNAIAKNRGDTGWAKVAWIAGGSAVGGLIGGFGGYYAAPYIMPVIGTVGTAAAPYVANAGDKAKQLLPVIGNKLDYVFGLASGNAHNIQRSMTMASQLSHIGIYNNDAGRNIMTQALNQVLNNPDTISRVQENGFVVREALLSGLGGFLKMETIWDGVKLITINLFG